jgi:PDZ domain-containing secreted protein
MKRTISLLGFGLILALAIDAGPAQGQVVAEGPSNCETSWASFGALGISGFSCDCTLNRTDSDLRWTFRGEPVITRIADGRNARRYRLGDVIVAIDGMLITTRAAGERVANLEPGKPVTLTLRRNGREIEVEIIPDEDCDDDIAVAVPMAPPSARSPRAPVATAAPRTPPPAAEAPVVAGPRTPPVPPTAPPPSAWFGFGISCHNCERGQRNQAEIRQRERELRTLLRSNDSESESAVNLTRKIEELRESGAEWKFSELPTVYSVDPDSPADEAGLRRGDVLVEIDGVSLLTPEGGRRFAAVQPGQAVTWTYRRGGTNRTVKVTAEEAPDSALRPQLAEARAALERLQSAETIQQRRANLDQLRAQLGRMESERAALAVADDTQHLRFSGSVGNTNVEVRGLSTVDVSYDNTTGELLIRTTDATIRVKAPVER